jgi:MerR family copper efflux transcriptional regulator
MTQGSSGRRLGSRLILPIVGRSSAKRGSMNIGQAASASGVSAKMIRYYEEIDLLPASVRSANGYRTYGEGDIHRLRFIRRARDFGFSLEEIRKLLQLWSDRSRPSHEVKKIALRHVAELEAKIGNLTELRNTLRDLARRCHGDGRPECPILHRLEGR